MLGLGLGAEPL